MVSYSFLKGHGTDHGDLSAERVRALCDRRAGIGADGVLRVIRTSALDSEIEWGTSAVEPVETSLRTEWFMDYRNSDGSFSEMCGNGIRVFARHLVEEGLVPADEPVRIGTGAGVKTVTWTGDVWTVDMGVAQVLGETKVGLEGRSWPAVHVDLGNPHAVAMVDDLAEVGSLVEEPAYDEALFQEGVNVEFVVRRGLDHLAMRVHERGSGETRSCGTGACAAAVAAAAGEGPGRWRVDVPGGELEVSRDEAGHVFLTGPALIVARGTTDL